jgi:hypothetical protein
MAYAVNEFLALNLDSKDVYPVRVARDPSLHIARGALVELLKDRLMQLALNEAIRNGKLLHIWGLTFDDGFK